LINGKENPELIRFFKENSSRIISETEVDNRTIDELFVNDKIRFSNAIGNDLYHQRRTYKDGELVFITNSSLTATATVNLSVEGKYLMELDAMSGDLFTYPSQPDGKYINAEITLPPVGSILLFSSSSGIGHYGVKPGMAGEKVVESDSPLDIKRMKDNALNIDFCDLIIDGQVERNLYTVEARSKLYTHFGHNDPWNSAIQYRRTIVEQDTFKTGNINVLYHFISIGDVDKFGAKLVAEQPDVWNMKINGKPISAIPGHYWLDSRWGVYDISKELKEGVNTVELSTAPMSIFAEISPVYILGDFSVESAPAGWIIRDPVTKLAPGSWKDQGYPQYAWDMSYSKNYQIEDISARYSLKLNKWNGTVAEVFVNDEKVGIIAYKPYHFDLTHYIKKGNNKIEVRVVGSLKNLFGPHYNKDKGINGPWHWNNVQKQAPGIDYNLFDYGLMEDFNVLKK
jgi:hypothetical protein